MIGNISHIMKSTGDNTKFVYIPKREQKVKFIYKELSAITPARKDVNISIAIMEAIRMSKNKKSKNAMEKRRYI